MSSSQADALPYRTVVAPVRVDKATRALHDEADWQPAYDALLYK